MFLLDELPNNKIRKNKFILPLNMKNKKINSVAILLTPNYESSKNVINHPLLVNKYYNSYYMNKPALYYINSDKSKSTIEESYINETYENMIRNDYITFSIDFKGLSSDVYDVYNIITKEFLDDLNIYGAKFNNITVYVGKNNIPESTSDTIYINTKSTYDKAIFKDYKNYIKFCSIITLLKKANPNLTEVMIYSIALYDSGIYIKTKNDWPFKMKYKGVCSCIDGYIEDKGELSYVNKIVLKKNDTKSLYKLFYRYIKNDSVMSGTINDVISMFSNDDSTQLSSYSYNSIDSNITNLNESEYIDLGDNEVFLFENSANDIKLKNVLYRDRMKTNKELLDFYKKVKEEVPVIKHTYPNMDQYRNMNMWYDVSFYNDIYIKNSTFKNLKGFDIYSDLMGRMINDELLIKNGYKNKTVIIPIHDWDDTINHEDKMWMINKTINPISCLYHILISNYDRLVKEYKDTIFLFLGNKAFFKVKFNELDIKKDTPLFLRNIKLLRDKSYTPSEDEDNTKETESSSKAIAIDIIDKVETSQNVNIDDISAVDKKEIKDDEKKNESPKDKAKKELVNKVVKAASTKTNVDDTIEDLDNDEMKDIIIQLSDEPDNGPSMSAARSARVLKLKNDLLDKKIKDRSLKDIIIDTDTKPEIEDDLSPVKPLELNIDSVNSEWKELKYQKIVESYDLDKGIVNIFNSLASIKDYPLYIKDIKVEDTSTSNDSIETYTVNFENDKGDRYTIKIDIPTFIDNKYMVLRGNRKELPNQLFLMPIIKTDLDTVQIVSCYNKIFISRFGSSSGKSIVQCTRLIRALNHEYKNIKCSIGDNSIICNKYELPIDYIDLSSMYNKIMTKNITIYFNQDEIRKKYDIDESNGIPIGYSKTTNSIIYYNSSSNPILSDYIAVTIMSDCNETKTDTEFIDNYYKQTQTKCTYSRASILGSKVPLIVVCSLQEGLEKVLKKANIEYNLYEKKPVAEPRYDIIKYKDGFLRFEISYDSSLLLNGLRDCATENTSIYDINKRQTWVSYLDYFGGRVLEDGLDNFYNLMIDKPITYNALLHYKLPTDYVEVLLYANQLLADNKYVAHGDIVSTRRIRRQEIIADCLYKVLSREYAQYSISRKHGKGKDFNIKRSAVIDEFMKLNISSDQSIINPLSEYESYNAVSARGPSGMNADRSYTLDKRTYDQSMLNVLSTSTGFAGTVGITRQATIDANIEKGGYINGAKDNIDEINSIKTLCMTEALTPFGTQCDDPQRIAMNFVQTSKHGMRCETSDPLLITNGAGEALPYLISNTFCFKSKDKGKVIEKTDKYMIVEYKNGDHDFINLDNTTHKNSSSGFYISIKLDTNLKVGSVFKENEILAYDKLSFSNKTGNGKDISYNIGTLSKIAVLVTDEGYEDSTIVSERLSNKMASDIVLSRNISLNKNTNIYNLCKKGQKIEEGDTLAVIQNSSEDEDISQLLKNLAGDNEEEINQLGRRTIHSKVTGIVDNIIITRNVDKEELSDSLRKIVDDYEKDINNTKKIMSKYGINSNTLPSTEKLQANGKLKNVDGVLIEIYMKYSDKFKVGDKLVYYSALKGVNKDMFPIGKEPKSEYRPTEVIDSLLTVSGINARMAMSVVKSGCINKVLIELMRQCKDILDIPYDLNL